MNVVELKKTLRLCYQARVPVMIWGHHGMGKSSAVLQLAEEEKAGFVDFRCAQIEASDLRGWPSKEGGRTVYNPPSELPTEDDVKAGRQPARGYLFLDELNRADDPVIQAVFQLVVERRLGNYRLPEGWMVVAAGNYGRGYRVNDFCTAFTGRWCHVELTKSEEYVGDWAQWMMKTHGDAASRVIQFIGTDLDDICSRQTQSLDFKQEPSPRLWDMLLRVERAAESGEFEKETVSAARHGLLGDLATKYEQVHFSIEPKKLVHEGVKVLEGVALDRKAGHLAGLVWGVAAYVKSAYLTETGKTVKWKIDEAKVDNVLDFVDWLAEREADADLALVLMTQILKPEMKGGGAPVLQNPALARILSDATSVWLRRLAVRSKSAKLYELTMRIREGR